MHNNNNGNNNNNRNSSRSSSSSSSSTISAAHKEGLAYYFYVNVLSNKITAELKLYMPFFIEMNAFVYFEINTKEYALGLF